MAQVIKGDKIMENRAFTLAEVLITLGIIGVVAAMTMPVLTAKTNDKVLETQNRKAQNVLANGMKMLMAKEDVTSLGHIALSACETSECIAAEMRKVFNIVEDIKSDGSNAPKEYTFSNGSFPIWTDSNLAYGFITNDGTMFGLKKFDKGSSTFTFVADLNGNKNPNTGAKDLCKYVVSSNGKLVDSCSAMESCGGTAYELPKNLYSWGLQGAMAAGEACSTGECSADQIDYRTTGGKCPDGYETVYVGSCCCYPVQTTSTSCF